MAQLRIEDFPVELLRAVKSKAAAEGMTLKAFMIDAARAALAGRTRPVSEPSPQERTPFHPDPKPRGGRS
jgi:hypothetical protein